jgi:hypothetical protein
MLQIIVTLSETLPPSSRQKLAFKDSFIALKKLTCLRLHSWTSILLRETHGARTVIRIR